MASLAYFCLLGVSILGPLARSFEPRIRYYKNWRAVLLSALIPAVVFIVMDEFFVQAHVWAFNPKFIVGIYVGHLPIEEVLFFFVVPYACLFIHETLGLHVRRQLRAKAWTASVGLALFTLAWAAYPRTYTSTICASAGEVLIWQSWWCSAERLGRYWMAFGVSLLPMCLVNGVLTALPVFWYNPETILNVRLGTIPFEDFVYFLALFFLNLSLYDRFRQRAGVEREVRQPVRAERGHDRNPQPAERDKANT